MIGNKKDWQLCNITMAGGEPPRGRKLARDELNGIAYLPTMTSFLIKGDSAEIFQTSIALDGCFESRLKRCALELFYSEWIPVQPPLPSKRPRQIWSACRHRQSSLM